MILATLIIIAAIAISVAVSIVLIWHFFDTEVRPKLLRDIQTVTKGSDLKCKACFDYVMSWDTKRPRHIAQSSTGKYQILKNCKTAVIIIDGQALCSTHIPPLYSVNVETKAKQYCMDVCRFTGGDLFVECLLPKGHEGDHDAIERPLKWNNHGFARKPNN